MDPNSKLQRTLVFFPDSLINKNTLLKHDTVCENTDNLNALDEVELTYLNAKA